MPPSVPVHGVGPAPRHGAGGGWTCACTLPVKTTTAATTTRLMRAINISFVGRPFQGRHAGVEAGLKGPPYHESARVVTLRPARSPVRDAERAGLRRAQFNPRRAVGGLEFEVGDEVFGEILGAVVDGAMELPHVRRVAQLVQRRHRGWRGAFPWAVVRNC